MHNFKMIHSSVKSEVDERWHAFRRQCRLFEMGKSDAALEEEFEELHENRLRLWAMPEYARAQHLIDADLVRASECVAFAYNNTVPYYNSSTMYLGDRSFLACEGPRKKDVPNFFQLLTTCRVTHLVRLTDSHEDGVDKCHPYWHGLLKESYLQVPMGHTLSTFDMAHWKDRQGVDPDELLNCVLCVRESMQEGGRLAVHCSAGVGRTGTFLAALAIVEVLDQGTPLSIEEIVYRLSLQRVMSVARSPQYITLYRLAERYLN